MAKLYSYSASREAIAKTNSVQELKIHYNRIPIFILERCGLQDSDEFPNFKEAVNKAPLLFDFALSRFIRSLDASELVRYYIPKYEEFHENEYLAYYRNYFPYNRLSTLYNQSSGYFEFYLTRNSVRDIYNLYFEDILDLKLALLRFCPTDILIGSYVEEKILRVRKRNYCIPHRVEPVKIEVKLENLPKRCLCEDICNRCWMVLCLSARAVIAILDRIYHSKFIAIYNGYTGYIISALENDKESHMAMCSLINGTYVADLAVLDTAAQTTVEITGLYADIQDLKSKIIPEFTYLEYNTYTRIPYSINSNTGKLCILIEEHTYKLKYDELPNILSIANGRLNVNDF